MLGDKSLFSELSGFVIYEPKLLREYLRRNELRNNNILEYFTETNHGDTITKNGIVIPMMGMENDYYNFSLVENMNDRIILDNKFSSNGLIMQIVSGEINIIGIGYFTNIERLFTINKNKILKFCIKNGWYEVEITGGIIEDELFYELLFTKMEVKPKFNGDINFLYKI